MGTTTLSNSHAFPQDQGTGSSQGDLDDAANFGETYRAVGFVDRVVTGLTISLNPSPPDFNLNKGLLTIKDGSAVATVSGETRDEGVAYSVEVEDENNVSLTDSAVNDVYIILDLTADDTVKLDVRTSGTPNTTPYLKIAEVDTTADTVTYFNRDYTHTGSFPGDNGDVLDLDQELPNGSDNDAVFSRISTEIVDNTDGSEDGALEVKAPKGGTVESKARFGENDVEINQETFLGLDTSAPADGDFDADIDSGLGQAQFYVDEASDNLKVKWVESDGSSYFTKTVGSSGSATKLDLGNDNNNESSDITLISTANDTNSIFTEPNDDELRADMDKNWPSADDAKQISRADDSGAVTHTNMTVTSGPSAGDEQSFDLQVDGNSFVKLFSEADGSGGLQNSRVDIGENLSLDGGTTEISSSEINILDGMSSKTGSDSNFVSGTSGSDGEFVQWNSDGDAVSKGNSFSDLVQVSGDTITGNIKFEDDVEAQFGTDPDYFFRYNSGGTQFELKSKDIDGVGTAGDIFRAQDGDQKLQIVDDAEFVGLSGNPTFSGHDHSETPLTKIPNGGLVNNTVAVSSGDGLINGGNVSLGGSTELDVRLDIDDSGSDVTTAYGINFGSNMSVSDDGDNTVTVSSTASGGQAVVLDLSDDGSNESEDLGEIATTGDTNGIFTEDATDKLLIDVSKNWPTADSAASLTLGDNETVAWGTDDDYEMEYVAGSTRFEFRTKDNDGGNTTGDIFRVDDGTDDVQFIGGISVDGESAPTSGIVLGDGSALDFGSGDFDITYDSGGTKLSFSETGVGEVFAFQEDGNIQAKNTLQAQDGSLALKFDDQASNPSNNGEFTLNGSDVKVYSGGSVRNLSDIGGTSVDRTEWIENATDSSSVSRSAPGSGKALRITGIRASDGLGQSFDVDIKEGGTTQATLEATAQSYDGTDESGSLLQYDFSSPYEVGANTSFSIADNGGINRNSLTIFGFTESV